MVKNYGKRQKEINMRVFISHNSRDTKLAEDYAVDLKKLGFKIYLDIYDPIIIGTIDKPLHIKSEIEKSTDLLVIITQNTKDSWWVPFEVGLSTSADNRIVSIIHPGSPSLPSFIRKWPIIRTDEQYKFYLEELTKNKDQLIKEHVIVESKNFSRVYDSTNSQQMSSSDLFHSILLSKFNQ